MADRDPLRHLRAEIAKLDAEGLLRTPRVGIPADALVLCSNDYLGYAGEPLADSDARGGAGASRLISGDHAAHRELEARLAAWLGFDEALLFSSGFAANVGVIPALCGEDDVIISDELNHASIIDGCRLSRARVVRTAHTDVSAVERALEEVVQPAKRRWVITESYFSMDGDSPDLSALRQLCDRHDAALIVDEAHAVGVFAEKGRGRCAAEGVVPDVLIGTLGKAIGLQGAFVAGNSNLRSWLWNRARSFVFSTGVSPWLAEITARRVDQIAEDEASRTRLNAIVARFRSALQARGVPVAPSHGPIVPWLLGDAQRTLEASHKLAAEGVFVQAIRPPTVPRGRARLRITLHAKLSEADLDRAVNALSAIQR